MVMGGGDLGRLLGRGAHSRCAKWKLSSFSQWDQEEQDRVRNNARYFSDSRNKPPWAKRIQI